MHCPAIQPGQAPHSSPIQNSGCRRFRISVAAHCARPFGVALSSPFPSSSFSISPPPSPSESRGTARLSYSSYSVVSISLSILEVLSSPEVMRCLEEYLEGVVGGSREANKPSGSLADGVFRGVATWNPGIRVSRGSLGRELYRFSTRDTPSSGPVSCPFHTPRWNSFTQNRFSRSVDKRKVSLLRRGARR